MKKPGMSLLLKRFVDQIIYLTEPAEIFLFGSFASGRERISSDIDLLVVKENLNNRQYLVREIASFISQYGYHSDIILMNNAELEIALKNEKNFLFNALKKSIKMYEKQA